MNKKLHDLMAILCTKTFYKTDLSKARLTKLVYLVDWEMSRRYGVTVSGVTWIFNHYGPYVDDVIDLAMRSVDFDIIVTRNAYGSIKEQICFVGDINRCHSLSEREINVAHDVFQKTEVMYFNEFIDYVYSTFPIRENDRYSILDLPRLAQMESLAKKNF